MIDDGISGALLWSLRMHRREGGFYWHMEVGTGRNIYKAFHWPGFASGDDYDERAVMKLMRQQGVRDSRRQNRRRSNARAAQLLPIESVSAISWQGSAGAAAYDVWRAPSRGGRGRESPKDVSDAESNTGRCSTTTRPIAGKHTGIASSPAIRRANRSRRTSSGPVAVDCRTLVDECRDLSLTASHEGDVTIATENARNVQEDCFIALPCQPVRRVVYRVDGRSAVTASSPSRPMRKPSWTSPSRPTAKNSGHSEPIVGRSPIQPNRVRLSDARSLRRRMPTATIATYLRITTPSSTVKDSEPDQKPLEISRVEIDFDCAAANPPATSRPQTQSTRPIFVDGPRRSPPRSTAIDAAAKPRRAPPQLSS